MQLCQNPLNLSWVKTILVGEIFSWKWSLVKRIEKIFWYKVFGQNKFGETNFGKNNFVAKKALGPKKL